MSADNWTVCPRCNFRHEKEAERLRDEADQAYGKLPVEEWRAKETAASEAATPFAETTFREDYEIGVYGSAFEVDYSGGCSVCGLSVSFKHEHRVEGIEA